MVLALYFWARGRRTYAVAVLLSFFGYLRVGELVALRRSDVVDKGDRRAYGCKRRMIVRIRSAKTGKTQWVELRSRLARRAVRWLLCHSGSNELFEFSASQFRYHLKAACIKLGLSSKYTPHSLRHGGATDDYLNNHPIDNIVV
jgi:integrase